MKRSMLARRLPAALAFTAVASFAHAQTLTASSWVPPSNHLTVTQNAWCEELEKKTTGGVKCKLVPKAVSAPPGTFDAVRDGLADLSFTVQGYTPGRFLLSQMAEFPFLGNTSEAVSLAFQRAYDRHAAFRSEYDGVKVIAVFTHGPGVVYNTKRVIARPEDLAGLKFRVGGGMVNEVAKALSMNVTLKPAPESYELLSTGVMDGTLMAAESVAAFKLDRLVKHATVFPGGLYNTAFVFFMNKARYDGLSPTAKKAVDELSGEHAARMFGRAWDRADVHGLAYMQAAGVQITRADAAFVDAVRRQTAQLEDKWAQAAEAKGLKNAKKILAEFRAEIAKLDR